jgi:hypothetical protein
MPEGPDHARAIGALSLGDDFDLDQLVRKGEAWVSRMVLATTGRPPKAFFRTLPAPTNFRQAGSPALASDAACCDEAAFQVHDGAMVPAAFFASGRALPRAVSGQATGWCSGSQAPMPTGYRW